MGDQLRVTASSGLKLRSAPSTDAPVIIFAMLQGTIVEALDASSPDPPHFVKVGVKLDQQNRFVMNEGDQPSTPANGNYVYEEGFASLDYLEPADAPEPQPQPEPGNDEPKTPPAVAAATGGGVMILLVALAAAALYAAK